MDEAAVAHPAKPSSSGSQADKREQLRQWVIKNSKRPDLTEIPDDLNIIEEKVITSVQSFDLILIIEKIVGQTIDLTDVQMETFQSIDTIAAAFFGN